MIGGYFYSQKEDAIAQRLQIMTAGSHCLEVFDNGCFFRTNPFQSELKAYASSETLMALSEDLLVIKDPSGSYRLADLNVDFLSEFRQKGPEAFNSIHSDFRMAVGSGQTAKPHLYLASNRAGSGRIFYHKLKNGIIFCSDLRLLLQIVPFEVNLKAVYSLLKYGSVPEPLTISEQISAIPAAHYLRYDANTGEEFLAPYFKYEFAADSQNALFQEETQLGRVKEVLCGTAAFLGKFPSEMLLSGGIDSSLYGCFLNKERPAGFQGFYCSFGQYDPEYRHACSIAERLGVKLQTAVMGKEDAMRALDDSVRLTDHPFSDFSSLPIIFLLQYIRNHRIGNSLVIECNGGDDCFGFGDLASERKFKMKHFFPRSLKKIIAISLAQSSYWKWEGAEGLLARMTALADVHERSYLNYFLVLAPVNYLHMNADSGWDESLQEMIEKTASSCGSGYSEMGYEAKTTIRQLLYVNSARWASKALSVGESLGMRVIYPYIWRDVLTEQGRLPWSAKIHDGVVKWPLKRLLEEYMPGDFIYRKKSGFVPPFVHWLKDPKFNDKVRATLLDSKAIVSEIIPARTLDELLMDARGGKQLRHSILNMLWGAFFTESWIRAQKAKSLSEQPKS
jgi:asparagine synthase (glutamine-hydrolysing)